MVTPVIWSKTALDDLQAISEYIGRDSPHHARRIVEEFFDLAELLDDLPDRGRNVPELNQPGLCERFLYSYRLIYEVKDNRIGILA